MTHKGNNAIPNGHFHKKWQLRIRTWFNQPARKIRKRIIRKRKAIKIAPRPLSALRPFVRCPSVRYHKKVRLGKGFSLEELKRIGLCQQFARSIGIAVDHRRRNKSVESIQTNVQRLKEYKSRLILFPLKKSKKFKKGEAEKDLQKLASQISIKKEMPVKTSKATFRSRAVTEDDRKFSAYAAIRKARIDAKLLGMRAKRLQAALDNPENFGKPSKKCKTDEQ